MSVGEGQRAPQQRLRVLWCITCMGFGGAERLLVSAARARDRAGFDYEIASILPGYRALVTELEESGVVSHGLGRTDHHWDLRWLWRLRRLLLERRYDIVHFHLPYAAGLGRLVARTLPRSVRPKVLTTEHNLWRTNHLAVRLVNSLTIPLQDRGIAVSQSVLEEIPRRHRHRFEVVVHGLILDDVMRDRDARGGVRAELGLGEDEVVIGTVANFRPGKGYDQLLLAARELLDRGVQVRFVAVGQGPLEREIREQHHELELGDRFLLLGFRADPLRVLSAMDIFVLTSEFEGFPISVMEALAMGVPVVATAVGGVPDAVSNGVHGVVVEPGARAHLVDALAGLVANAERRGEMAAAAHVRGAQFDIAGATRRIEQIYRELLAAEGALAHEADRR